MKKILLLVLLIAVCKTDCMYSQVIYTIAGDGGPGSTGDGGPAGMAGVSQAIYVAASSNGIVYIDNRGNNTIRKINNGIITRIAGNGSFGFNGDSTIAYNNPISGSNGVAVDAIGNVYIAGASRVLKIDTAGLIYSLAGNGTSGYSGDNGLATNAILGDAEGITIDKKGNIYFTDDTYYTLRKIDTAGIITTIAGTPGVGGYSGDNGLAVNAKLYFPFGTTVDKNGNIYIADAGNHRIRKIDTVGIITTIAGNGNAGYSGDNINATNTELNSPRGIAIDSVGIIYIADRLNNRIRKIDTNGTITTYAGNGTQGYYGDGISPTFAEMHSPSGVALDGNGNLYITDVDNYYIRKICTSCVFTPTPGFIFNGGDNNFCTSGSTELYLFGTYLDINSSAIHYQWQQSTNYINWNNVGGNYTTYITNTLTATTYFRVIVSSADTGTFYTSPVDTVTILQPVLPAVNISLNSDTLICTGALAAFTAVDTNGGATPVYQWYKNGLPVGTDSVIYTDNSLNNQDVVTCNMYSSVQCPSVDTVSSNPVTVTVSNAITPSIIISANQGTTINAGTPVTFTAIPSGGGIAPTYEWIKNGNIAGTGATYTDNALENNDTITCVLHSNADCASVDTATSNQLIIHVAESVSQIKNSSSNLLLYPNPNNGSCIIEGTLNNIGQAQITVLNTIGQVVYITSGLSSGNKLNEQIVLPADIADGLYYVRIKVGNDNYILHFAKQQY